MSRKAPRYWPTRFSITVQPATTTSGVMKELSSTNSIEMPSTPRWYQTLKRGIHSWRSTNCMAGVARLKPVYRGIVTRKPSSAPASAILRCNGARSSPPQASTSRPARIGTQIARLSSISSASSRKHAVLDHGVDRAHAEDHHEGVPVDQPALHQAHHAGEPAHQARGAVHHHAVDGHLVAALPQARADHARALREQPGVELVEAVLALDQGVERAEGCSDFFRQIESYPVQVPR